jgi:hypothetical protein
MNLLFLTVVIVVIGGVLLGCELHNRRRRSLERLARRVVLQRFSQRSRLQIGSILDHCGIREEDQLTAGELLREIANIIEVPVETLRPDDRLGRLCKVELTEMHVEKGPGVTGPVFHRYYEFLHLLERNLDETQWTRFLAAVGAKPASEEHIVDCFLENRLADNLRFVVDAKTCKDT